MAKFCGRCGAKLDEQTGLCPNCDDVPVLTKEELPPEPPLTAPAAEEPSARQERPSITETVRKSEKADVKRHQKRKRGGVLVAVLCVLEALLAVVGAVCIVGGLLLRFRVITIPGSSRVAVEVRNAVNLISSQKNVEYRESNYNAAGKLTGSHEFLYDSKGRVSGLIVYNAAGKEIDRAEYRYDEEGRVTENAYFEDDASLGTVYFEYGVDGAETTTKVTYSGQRCYNLLHYDEDGKMYRMEHYDRYGVCESYYIAEYDSEGRQTMYTGYDASDDSVFFTESSVYDGDKLIRQDSYNLRGELVGQTSYTYDAQGNCVECKQYDGDGKLYQTVEIEYKDVPVEQKIWRPW